MKAKSREYIKCRTKSCPSTAGINVFNTSILPHWRNTLPITILLLLIIPKICLRWLHKSESHKVVQLNTLTRSNETLSVYSHQYCGTDNAWRPQRWAILSYVYRQSHPHYRNIYCEAKKQVVQVPEGLLQPCHNINQTKSTNGTSKIRLWLWTTESKSW